jgi:hypothetical protein
MTILLLLMADWIGLFDCRGSEAVSFPCHEVIEPLGGEVNRRTRPTGGHPVREWNEMGREESPGGVCSRI